MGQPVLLPYGLAPNGRMVTVEEVSRGLLRDIRCACCGSPLVARKGSVVRHHFAHESVADCAGAIETTLHRYGKQALADAKRVFLPPVVARWKWRESTVEPARVFYADRVEVEATVGRLRVDALLFSGNDRLAVEIVVSHPCDSEKIATLRELGLDTLEIVLPRHLSGSSSPSDQVIAAAHRRWVHHRKIEASIASWEEEASAAQERAESEARAARARYGALQATPTRVPVRAAVAPLRVTPSAQPPSSSQASVWMNGVFVPVQLSPVLRAGPADPSSETMEQKIARWCAMPINAKQWAEWERKLGVSWR